MGTKIRPELSEKNTYWIERHRYYELKHFCLQYQTWRKAYAALDGLSKRPTDLSTFITGGFCSDPTAKCAIAKAFYSERIDMIEKLAKETDVDLSFYILKAVTEGVSYDCLTIVYGIPCCKDSYYKLYRRFFWLLNKTRN